MWKIIHFKYFAEIFCTANYNLHKILQMMWQIYRIGRKTFSYRQQFPNFGLCIEEKIICSLSQKIPLNACNSCSYFPNRFNLASKEPIFFFAQKYILSLACALFNRMCFMHLFILPSTMNRFSQTTLFSLVWTACKLVSRLLWTTLLTLSVNYT